MSNLKNNTAALEALIEQANALPEEKTIQSSKTVTPTTSSQTVTPDSGYDGLASVVVAGDADLVPENIADGVSIFGVSGTAKMEEPATTIYAKLYDDGELVIQNDDVEEANRVVLNSYNFSNKEVFTDSESTPWCDDSYKIRAVSFRDKVSLNNFSYMFSGLRQMTQFNLGQMNMNNMVKMSYAYYDCRNLTGSPVCGSNVTNMSNAYINCLNLTGSPICGSNVTNMYGTYYNCRNLTGNAYFYSSSVDDACACFSNKNNSVRLNIYVLSGTQTNNVVHYNQWNSLVGKTITWTNAGTHQYNTTYNIYIYPVTNVSAAAIANGDEEANANAGITTGTNVPVHQ